MSFSEIVRKDSKRSKKGDSLGNESLQALIEHFLKVEDSLGGEKIDLQLLDSLLPSEDLDSDYDSAIVGYQFMGSLAAYAEQRYDDYKLVCKKIYAELTTEAHDGNVIPGRVTDSKASAYVESHQRHIKAQRRLSRYKRAMTVFEIARQAFDKKFESVRSKAANQRQTMDRPTEPVNGSLADTRMRGGDVPRKKRKLKKKRNPT